jgi:hypothetical protein
MFHNDLIQDRFWSKVLLDDDEKCWEWQGYRCRRQGYGDFRPIRGSKVPIHAHRAAYELFYGVVPGELHVCHRCDNRGCVNPSHLFLGTNADNMRDRDAKGRVFKGSQCGNSKVTETDVVEIRRLYESGLSQAAIARRYGLTQPTVGHMCRRSTWKHVP